MKVLLLSPYDAASHKRWRLGLQQHLTEFDFTMLSLPPRYFDWRMRGNSLTWAMADDPRLRCEYDLLIATSMTDLSALKGMCPQLSKIPSIAYFHENQFAYPSRAIQQNLLHDRILNLYTALAADRVVFNSNYNRKTFLTGVTNLLADMPDQVPEGITDKLAAASRVIPVPLEKGSFHAGAKADRFTLAWNHRWEYDKGPERLLLLVRRLQSIGIDFNMHLLGQQFRRCPPEMEEVIECLKAAGCLGQCGYVSDAERYRNLLAESHVVLSTALHEFQGLSVLEAVACGCLPVVPDRLVYQEIIPAAFRYNSCEDKEAEADSAASKIVAIKQMADESRLMAAPAVDQFLWGHLVAEYRQLFTELAA
jgi:glycosyltransferase involved in cell wall biosynthesis|tara:strand:- start:27931 stop:29025 length:1095 start_codon:yes stop_codon:yes gene_type:complete